MAARFTIVKLGWLFKFFRPQWGVRGSLFSAFAVIAGIALVISIGAAVVLGHLGRSMVELSGRDIPRLAASLQLSAQSASLASHGPALLASASEDALNERSRKMKETQAVTLEKLGQIIELGADKAVAEVLTETVKNIDDTIKSLAAAARARLEATAQRARLYDAVRKAQASFVALAGPAMLSAQTQLNAILGSANPSPDDATEAARAVEQIGNVVASSNLSASDMTAALSANSSDTLEAIEKEFKASQARVKSNLDLLPKGSATTALRDAALKLLALGEGKTGVFKLRQKELDANDYGQIILDETRKLNVGLGISVQQLVTGVQGETDAATAQSRKEISLATTVMLALGALTLIGSVLFVWLYVGRNILRRIGNLQRSMRLLSDGDLETEIYRSSQRRNRGDGGFAADFPREHDRGPRAERRSGQGSHRQGRTRLPHGGPDRRIRGNRPRRAGQPAEVGHFHAGHGAKHVGDRRSIQCAGERGCVRRRGNLRQRANRVFGHRGTFLVNLRNRPPGYYFGRNCPQSRRRGRCHRRHHARARRKRQPHQRRG
jgi:hypothetical protein